jgi:hypothetical protein
MYNPEVGLRMEVTTFPVVSARYRTTLENGWSYIPASFSDASDLAELATSQLGSGHRHHRPMPLAFLDADSQSDIGAFRYHSRIGYQTHKNLLHSLAMPDLSVTSGTGQSPDAGKCRCRSYFFGIYI